MKSYACFFLLSLLGVTLVFSPCARSQTSVSESMPEAQGYRTDDVSSKERADASFTGLPGLSVQIAQLEEQNRSLQGALEEVNHQLVVIAGRLEQIQQDWDSRLQRMEQLLHIRSDTGLAVDGSAVDPDMAASARDGPETIGTSSSARTPTTSQTSSATSVATEGESVVMATPVSAEESYEKAFSLLKQEKYADAEVSFRAFLQDFPEDELSGNAAYWLGETFYVRQDYKRAAITFGEALKDYPQSRKGPDILFKLAVSLIGMGARTDACTALEELPKRYPKARSGLKQMAQRELVQLRCSEASG